MKKALAIIAALFFAVSAYAQIETPVKWAYAAKRTSPTEATIYLKAIIQDGWHIYSQHIKEGGPIKTSFIFTPAKNYTLAGKTIEPKAIVKYDNQFKMNIGFFEKNVVFTQKIKLKAGATTIKGQLEYMVCNNMKCLPPEDVDFTIPISK